MKVLVAAVFCLVALATTNAILPMYPHPLPHMVGRFPGMFPFPGVMGYPGHFLPGYASAGHPHVPATAGYTAPAAEPTAYAGAAEPTVYTAHGTHSVPYTEPVPESVHYGTPLVY